MNRTAEQKTAARENRSLDVETVRDSLSDMAPAALHHAKQVGNWIWICFPEKPDEETRAALLDLGFSWCKRRLAWMHPCGHFVKHRAPYDPRDKYGERDLEQERERAQS